MHYVTYDDDCSVCTKFARIIRIITAGRIPILKMNSKKILQMGYKEIGPDEYWQSFHVVSNGRWFSEGKAIEELLKLLPFGRILHYFGKRKPIKSNLAKLLKLFQKRRKLECKITNPSAFHQ